MSEEQIIDMLYHIVIELDARNSVSNCVNPELLSYGWNNLCDKGIELFQQLKEK